MSDRQTRYLAPKLHLVRERGFYARIYLHRLPPEDRDAALALLDETAAARRA
jgi:hypothetical protein